MDVLIMFSTQQDERKHQRISNETPTGVNSRKKWSKPTFLPSVTLLILLKSFSLLNKFQKFNHFEGC